MRTALVSDLHLGDASGADLLHRRRFRERLLSELAGADRVVLLGDVIELRHGPLAEALQAARPFFEELGEAIGDAELVIVPGNHDYQLLGPWLERLRRREARRPLGLGEWFRPDEGAPRQLAAWAGPGRTVLAYPGLRIRDDVYATHGHDLDAHTPIPVLERLAVGMVARVSGGPPEGPSVPGDYERVQAPLYALLFDRAQRGSRRPMRRGHAPSMRIWEAVGAATGRAPTLRGWLLGAAAIPAATRVANRLGLGPLGSELSVSELSRAGVRAMAKVVEGLGIEAEHVIFGHTHRRGPLPGEEGPGSDPDWTAGAVRLHNAGNWICAPALLGPAAERSPFWPGTIIEVVDDAPPRARNLLDGVDRRELRAALRGRR